jgi:hypothetical protein
MRRVDRRTWDVQCSVTWESGRDALRLGFRSSWATGLALWMAPSRRTRVLLKVEALVRCLRELIAVFALAMAQTRVEVPSPRPEGDRLSSLEADPYFASVVEGQRAPMI